MSQAIRDTFERCRQAGRSAFIPYITAGFPSKADTVPLMLAFEKAGADIIELGMPFSDPLADGPTIQYANTVSLSDGTDYADCLRFIKEAREQGLKAPIVLMGYVNPLIQYGEEKAVLDAKEAGANAFIIVDLPLEEQPLFFKACRTHGLSFIPLVTPTTKDSRISMLVNAADSFLYVVSVTGITGERKELPEYLPKFIDNIRSKTKLPLAIGFGISSRVHYEQVEKLADAVVIGSAIIRAVRDADADKRCAAVDTFIHSVTGR
jgi:tryptophan synthase alpha subunit